MIYTNYYYYSYSYVYCVGAFDLINVDKFLVFVCRWYSLFVLIFHFLLLDVFLSHIGYVIFTAKDFNELCLIVADASLHYFHAWSKQSFECIYVQNCIRRWCEKRMKNKIWKWKINRLEMFVIFIWQYKSLLNKMLVYKLCTVHIYCNK